MRALIGHTGFVGSNLDRQFRFDKKYNSSNIREIVHNEFDFIVCAGVSGTKWIANKYPEEDIRSINKLLSNLGKIKCRKFILISTVDVYEKAVDVDEDTQIYIDRLQPYGKNRALVEEFIMDKFDDYHIIRLPAIYGYGIKKNFVYDLLNNHCLEWTHKDSIFQFYHLQNLWRDIQVVLKNNIKLINFSSEPIKAQELANECFDIKFTNVTKRKPLIYDVRSEFSHLFSINGEYMYNKKQVIKEMKEFIKNYKK